MENINKGRWINIIKYQIDMAVFKAGAVVIRAEEWIFREP